MDSPYGDYQGKVPSDSRETIRPMNSISSTDPVGEGPALTLVSAPQPW